MEEDDALMERSKAGDKAAFDLLVRRHQGRLQRFATRMAGGDAARGADVAVGALLRLWETRQAYHPAGKTEAWLLRTAYRMLVDEVRRDRPGADLDEIAVLPAPMEQAALGEAVRDAITELPEGHRAVIVLSVYEGQDGNAIAEILGIPVGTVASRKSHALKTLRRRLAAWEDPA